MTTVAVPGLGECDGFALESASGLGGWVEETWRSPGGEPAALAVRLADGRRALLLAEQVLAVDADTESVLVPRDARLLELAPPEAEQAAGVPAHLSASWTTTGNVVELPAQAIPHARREVGGRPTWQTIALMYAGLAVLTGLEVGLAFLVAYLVTGHGPY